MSFLTFSQSFNDMKLISMCTYIYGAFVRQGDTLPLKHYLHWNIMPKTQDTPTLSNYTDTAQAHPVGSAYTYQCWELGEAVTRLG